MTPRSPRARRWKWLGWTAALVLVASLTAACGSSPSAGKKPPPTPTPCPAQAAPGVWVRGCVVLYDGDNLDLDGGQVNVSSYDLAFAQGSLTLAPGTQAAYLGVLDFNSIMPSQIGASNLGTGGYQLSQLATGGVMAVRTGQGRPAKVRFDVIGKAVLHLSFFTYSSASVPAPAPTTTPTPSHGHPTPTPSPTSHTSPHASPSASPSP